MKGVIIYKGKYGSTLQYAQWLAAELRLPLLPVEKANAGTISRYDFVVLGSAVYMGKIMMCKWLKKYADLLAGKKVYLFIVCATPIAEEDKLEVMRRKNVPQVLVNQCVVHFLHGRIVKEKLSWTDRFMLHMGAMLQKDPLIKKTMLQNFDDVRKENIIPMVKEIKEYALKTKPRIPLHMLN